MVPNLTDSARDRFHPLSFQFEDFICILHSKTENHSKNLCCSLEWISSFEKIISPLPRLTVSTYHLTHRYDAQNGISNETLTARQEENDTNEQSHGISYDNNERTLNDSYFQQSDHTSQQQRQLPRADGGKDAWLFLAYAISPVTQI